MCLPKINPTSNLLRQLKHLLKASHHRMEEPSVIRPINFKDVFLCMCMFATCIWVSTEAKRGCQMSWSWTREESLATQGRCQ